MGRGLAHFSACIAMFHVYASEPKNVPVPLRLSFHAGSPKSRTDWALRAGDWLVFRPIWPCFLHTPAGRKMCLSP